MKRWKTILLYLAVFAVPAGLVIGQTYTTRQPGSNLVGYQDYETVPGNIWWVSSVTGTDSVGAGRSPSNPFATVDYAVGKTTANKNDVIFVMPAHVEDGSTTTIFDADVAGISIIGLGNGLDRPEFHFNNAADIISIGADNVTIKNLVFVPSVTTITVGVNVEANVDHFTMEGCEFTVGEAAGTDEFVAALVLNSGANDAVIKNNKFFTAITDTHCTEAIGLGVAGAVARVEISDNYFYGNWSTAAIIDGTTACTEILISGNDIKVKDGEPGIELAATTTATIVNNNIASSGVTCSAAIVAADGEWFNNYCVTTDGAAAVPIGLDSAIGTTFMISKALAHTAIVTGGAALTGAATGTLMLEEVIILNGTTALGAAAANSVALYTDNVQGPGVFILWADTVFAADSVVDTNMLPGATVGTATATAKTNILLNGKKLYVKASASNGNTDGNLTIYMIFRRLSVGATIAAG